MVIALPIRFHHGKIDGISTLHSFISPIKHGFSGWAYTGCVMFDITGAFDHTYHSALIILLRKKNCPIHLIEILASFHSNRNATLRLRKRNRNSWNKHALPTGKYFVATPVAHLHRWRTWNIIFASRTHPRFRWWYFSNKDWYEFNGRSDEFTKSVRFYNKWVSKQYPSLNKKKSK